MIPVMGYAAFGLSGVAGGLYLLLVLISKWRERSASAVRYLGWSGVLREVIRTDSRMLTDAIRLSVEHFRAVNELRKLGGGR